MMRIPTTSNTKTPYLFRVGIATEFHNFNPFNTAGGAYFETELGRGFGLGFSAVIPGDPTQIDLPNKSMSGLVRSKELLGHLNEISVIDFDHSDVVRHPLVSKIVKAYSNND